MQRAPVIRGTSSTTVRILCIIAVAVVLPAGIAFQCRNSDLFCSAESASALKAIVTNMRSRIGFKQVQNWFQADMRRSAAIVIPMSLPMMLLLIATVLMPLSHNAEIRDAKKVLRYAFWLFWPCAVISYVLCQYCLPHLYIAHPDQLKTAEDTCKMPDTVRSHYDPA